MDTRYTTVRISVETQKRLIALGKKGETYEEIICKLLDSEEDDALAPKRSKVKHSEK